MYISKIALEKREPHRVAALLGADIYGAHKTCWKLFSNTDNRNFLYRRISDGFITLSHRIPEDTDRLWKIDVKPFAPKLQRGDLLDFMVTANATVCRNGKRHDVIMNAKTAEKEPDTAARDWLNRCGARSGFQVKLARVGAYRQHVLRKPGHVIKFSTIDYDGTIEVDDPPKLVQALSNGIGRAKGFGCGLLLVRRSPS